MEYVIVATALAFIFTAAVSLWRQEQAENDVEAMVEPKEWDPVNWSYLKRWQNAD